MAASAASPRVEVVGGGGDIGATINPPLRERDDVLNELAQRVFHNTLSTGTSRAPYSGASIDTMYVGSDVTWASRSVIDLLSALKIPGIGGTGYFYQSHGWTTAGNTFIAPLELRTAYSRLMRGIKEGDKEKIVAALISLVQGTFQFFGGLAYLAFRPLAVVAMVRGIDTSSFSVPSLLGKITYGFGAVGNALWGAFFAVLGLSGLLRVVRVALGAKDIKDLDAVQNKLTVTDADISAKYDNEKLKNEALNKGADVLHSLLKQTDDPEYNQLSKRQCRELLEGVFNDSSNILQNEGREIVKEHLSKLREEGLTKITSAKTVEKLKTLLAEGAEEIPADLMKSMNREWMVNLLFNIGLVTLGVLGVAATAASFVFTGGISAAVVAAVFIAVIVLMFVLDGYSMHKDFKEGQAGKYDAAIVMTHMVVGILAITASAVLTGLFSFGVVPLVCILVFGGGLLATDVYALHKILQSRSQEKEEHPTVPFFLRIVNSQSYSDERIAGIFSRLPGVNVEEMEEDGAIRRTDLGDRIISIDRGALREAAIAAERHLEEERQGILRGLVEGLRSLCQQ